MLKYLVLIVQETAISSVILGLTLGYSYHFYDKGKRLREQKSSPLFYTSLSIIIGFSIALLVAIIDSNSQIIKRAYLNIVLLIITIIAQITFLVVARIKINDKENKVLLYFRNISILLINICLISYYAVDVFLAPLQFTYDGTSLLSTDFLFKLIGYSLSLVFALVITIGFSKICEKKNLLYVWIISVVLLIPIIFQETMLFIKPMMARRLIPMIRWLFKLLVFVLNNNNIFSYFILLVLIVTAISLYFRSYSIRYSYSNSAELRKIKSENRRVRRWCKTVVIFSIIMILTLSVVKNYNEKEVELSPSEEFILEDGIIKIPLENVDDGHLHRFTYKGNENIDVRFIVIKKSLVAYGLGLDACEICGATGYYERKDGVVCKRCDVVMNITTIGFKGGCNPIPFEYKVKNGSLYILGSELDKYQKIFK